MTNKQFHERDLAKALFLSVAFTKAAEKFEFEVAEGTYDEIYNEVMKEFMELHGLILDDDSLEAFQQILSERHDF